MKLWNKKPLSIVIMLAVVVGTLTCVMQIKPVQIAQASYSNLTSDSIKDKEAQIEAAEKEKEELQSNMTDLQKLLKDLEAAKGNLSNYVVTLDSALEEVNAKIDELIKLIADKQAEIVVSEQELEAALLVEEEQYVQMQKRIQFIYEQGNSALAEMILSSTSFGDVLNKADYVEMLSSYDRQMLDGYIETRESVETIKALLVAEKAALDEANETVQSEQDSLEKLIKEKEKEIAIYQSDISNKEGLRAELENQIAQEASIIKALELAVAEERRKIAEENGLLLEYDGGMFAWPAPEYTRISSDYGYRIHPILGEEIFHSGVDMAAPGGSPILAAYNGKVIASGYSSSMGNYVMIDHGDELYTIYMHARDLYAKAGSYVSRGEKIATVGTTGLSTGNHLHFGVRLNGNYVNPWTYLK